MHLLRKYASKRVSHFRPSDLDLWPRDLELVLPVTLHVDNLPWKFERCTVFRFRVDAWRLARDRQTYRQTDGLDRVTWPPRGRLHNKDLIKLLTCFLSYFLKCLLSTRQPITLSLCLTEIHWNYKILKIHCRNVGIFLNYKRCYVMELVSALAALGAVLYLASVNTRSARDVHFNDAVFRSAANQT